MVYCK